MDKLQSVLDGMRDIEKTGVENDIEAIISRAESMANRLTISMVESIVECAIVEALEHGNQVEFYQALPYYSQIDRVMSAYSGHDEMSAVDEMCEELGGKVEGWQRVDMLLEELARTELEQLRDDEYDWTVYDDDGCEGNWSDVPEEEEWHFELIVFGESIEFRGDGGDSPGEMINERIDRACGM